MRTCEHCGKRVPTGEQRARIRELADGLKTINQIAEATGVTYNHIYQLARKEELSVRKLDRKERQWARYMLAAQRKVEGKTLTEIGAELGVGRERARQMIQDIERINRKIGEAT